MIHSGSADLLRQLTEPISRIVPPGFKPITRWAVDLGRSEKTVNELLKKALKEGLAEARVFSIPRQDGRYIPVMHYRLKEAPSKGKGRV